MELENFSLAISEILGMFVNTLNADDKYSLCNREDLRQPIQTQFSKKQKIFSKDFATFLKSTSSFKHCEKKDEPQSLSISEIRDCKKRG